MTHMSMICIPLVRIIGMCVIHTCIIDTRTYIMDTCIMDTSIMDTSVWVTRPERPTGAKDEVKEAQRATDLKLGPGGPPKLLISNTCLKS